MAPSGDPFPADSFVATAGSSLHLLRRQPLPDAGGGGDPHFSEVLVAHSAPLGAARWNRNNKVVAAGSADGSIQLLYAGGTVMGVLPRDGTPPAQLGRITSLSWSVGSKRLAAGSGNGSVYIHDIQAKSMTELSSHSGAVTAVEFQHEDKFLAVASSGGSVALYPGPFKPGSPALQLQPSGIDGSARLCLSLAASGDAAIAAGSAQGGVAVWDAPTRRLVEEYPSHHSSGRVNAVSFVPLRPDWLYSAGDDGIVCLQDRKSGRGHVSATPVGAPATALMVREDHSMLGVGTADGVVKLYDPRNTRQPVKTLRLQAGPVSSLHWQHRFLSLSRQRAAAAPASASQPAAAATGAALAPPAAAAAPSVGSRIPARTAAAVGAASTAGIMGQQASAPGAGSGAMPADGTGAAASAAWPLQQARSSRVVAAEAPPAATHLTPSSRPAGNRATAAAPALAVTPLTGPASRYGAAAAAPAFGEVTPAAPRGDLGPTASAVDEAQQTQQQQQLSITPLGGHALPRSAAGGTPAAAAAADATAQGGAPPESPLELLAAAPMSLDVTPLLAPPTARHLGGGAAHEGGLPPPLAVSQLGSAGSLGDGSSAAGGLCVSPLPGTAGARAGSPAAASPSQQRSVLGERSPNRGSSGAGSARAAAVPRLLPGLAPPLPAAGLQEEQPQLHGSPSFAENLPLPSPAVTPPAATPKQQGGQQQETQQRGHLAADAARPARQDGALKAKAAGSMVSHASISPASSGGSPRRWAIGTHPAAQQQAQPPAAPPAAPQPSAAEFCFAVAEQQQRQLGAGAEAWSAAVAGVCQAGPAVMAAAAASGAPLAGDGSGAGPLRDELLAMHVDMLAQFQAQQACMGELVGRVLERSEALGSEVAALRRQLAALATRRDDFLWL